MFAILTTMILGVFCGYVLRKRTRLLRYLEQLTGLAVYALLFLLGLAVGGNRVIMSGLHELGLQALILSVGSVTGSVILCLLLYIRLFREDTADES